MLTPHLGAKCDTLTAMRVLCDEAPVGPLLHHIRPHTIMFFTAPVDPRHKTLLSSEILGRSYQEGILVAPVA